MVLPIAVLNLMFIGTVTEKYAFLRRTAPMTSEM